MSDGILYDQEVTLQNLSDIVTDLGQTTFSGFTEEGPPYAVDELNAITKDLVTKGVLRGIMNTCNLSLNNPVLTVDTGVIVFGTGAKLRLESAKTISTTSGAKNYIYAEHSTTDNTIKLICSTTLPDYSNNDNQVFIAEISSTGVLSDKREYAQMKNASLLPNLYKSIHDNGSSGGITVTVPGKGSVIKEYDLGGDYKKIYLTYDPSKFSSGTTSTSYFKCYADLSGPYAAGFYYTYNYEYSGGLERYDTKAVGEIRYGKELNHIIYQVNNALQCYINGDTLKIENGVLKMEFVNTNSSAMTYSFDLEVM